MANFRTFNKLFILLTTVYIVRSSSEHHQSYTDLNSYEPVLDTQYYEFNTVNASEDSNYSLDPSPSFQPSKYVNYHRHKDPSPYDEDAAIGPHYVSKAKARPDYWRLWKRHPSLSSAYKRRRSHKYRKASISDPTYSRSDYIPIKRRGYKKNKWADRQGGFFDDVFEDFSLDSILPELPIPDFLLSGLGDYVDEGGEEDHGYDDFFGYGDDEEEEEYDEPELGESYQRPWAYSHYGDRNPLRYGGYDRIRDRVSTSGGNRRVFGRHAMKKLFGKGLKFLIALLLLPLILLFIPIPIMSSNTSNKNSRDGTTGGEETETGGGQWGSIHEFGRRVLSSEDCIERISCEINRFQHASGPEAEDQSFKRFARFVNKYATFFPSFLVRVARGYSVTPDAEEDDPNCSKFSCQNFQILS